MIIKQKNIKKSCLLDLCNYLLEDEISILESEITEYLNSIYNTDFTVLEMILYKKQKINFN